MKDWLYAVGKYAAIATLAVSSLWMRVPYVIQLLLLLMGLDIVSGLLAAFRQRKLNSSVMLRGLVTKLAVFPLLALLHLVEKPLNLPFELESIGAFGFLIYEAMSIIENCANAGAPVPAVIVVALAKAKIRTATPEEIRKEFGETTETKISVGKSVEIVKTPGPAPDLQVEQKTTTIEERHVKPVDQKEA